MAGGNVYIYSRKFDYSKKQAKVNISKKTTMLGSGYGRNHNQHHRDATDGMDML
jgi:hypothetical protein